QAVVARWITGAFCTSPSGAVETLAGLPPIHFHIQQLVERSHTRFRTLARSHATRLLVEGDHPSSMARLSYTEQTKVRSPISEAWANLDLCSRDLLPYNKFNAPGERFQDRFPDRAIFDMPLPVRGKKEAVAKYREARKSE